MNESIYFDDGLPAFAALTLTAWGEEALEKNLFLRDADGRLTLGDCSAQAAITQL
jgi:hypothetical protein